MLDRAERRRLAVAAMAAAALVVVAPAPPRPGLAAQGGAGSPVRTPTAAV